MTVRISQVKTPSDSDKAWMRRALIATFGQAPFNESWSDARASEHVHRMLHLAHHTGCVLLAHHDDAVAGAILIVKLEVTNPIFNGLRQFGVREGDWYVAELLFEANEREEVGLALLRAAQAKMQECSVPALWGRIKEGAESFESLYAAVGRDVGRYTPPPKPAPFTQTGHSCAGRSRHRPCAAHYPVRVFRAEMTRASSAV